MGGCSDDESSDDDRNHKEESSQQSGRYQEVASDVETEKHDVTTTDADIEVEPTASHSPASKSARKRKVDAEKEEIDTKRSKFEDKPGETGVESSFSLLPGARKQTEISEPVNCPSSADRRSSANSGDRPQASLSGSFSQDSSAATASRIEQVVKSPEPDTEKSTSSESMKLSPAEKTPSAESSTSKDDPRVEPMDSGTTAETSEQKALLTDKPDRVSHKKSFRCRSSIQDDNRQRDEEVLPAESRDSVESRASSSRDADRQMMRQMPGPRGVPRERRHVKMCDRSTQTDFPGAVTSSTESRRSREITEATREFFKKFDRRRPKDPRMSGRKRTGGNTGRSEERSIRIQYEDIAKHPLFRLRPTLGRPGPSSEPEFITTYYHKDTRGNMHYYREYPGLSLQPFSVKKDAIYQKRFYRENKSMILPIKMGEMIQWGINMAKDLADEIPRYSMSDEEQLSLDDYHALSQQLMKGFVTAYKSASVKEWKNLRDRKKRRAEQRKSSYVTSSFQEESPGDSSGDETIYSPSLYRTSEEDPAELLVSPIRSHESAPHSTSLQMPHFSFESNVSRSLPQSAFLQASALEVEGPSTSRHQNFQHNPEHRIRGYRYESFSNPRGSLQSVQIKFFPETSLRSTRLIYCRDNMSFASDEASRIRLKPFLEVVEVLPLEHHYPSVSVEEFLQTLFSLQGLYYQLLYDESERFYTLRDYIYRCVIPMRNVESHNDELDGNNPKPSTSGSGQSSKSLDSSREASFSTSETNRASQQQIRNNYPSGRQENLKDDVQLASKENIGQSEESMPHPRISFPSKSRTGLFSFEKTWELAVNRSESRGSLSLCNLNLAGTATSKNVAGKEFAVGTSVNEKRKHTVWFPPTAEEANEGTGLDCPPNSSETESASE